MLDNVKNKITFFIINYRLKKKHFTKQSFTDVFKKSDSFFILLPEDEIDFHHSIDALNFFETHNKKFFIFTNDFRISLLPAKLRSNSFDFGLKDVTFLKLPSKQLATKLSEINADVVIDLNRKENLFFSYTANLAETKVRIGFEKNNSDKFYNMQFANGKENSEFFYKNFLNCLRMF
ncbi:MAG: hypothetical protein ACYCVH_03805 [Ignavibacteriaceae bacterium]